MYVSPISTRLVRGRSTPAMRAIRLSLPLLVLGVAADHADDTLPPHDLALVTNLPNRRPYLHTFLPIRPSERSAPASCRAVSAPPRLDRRPALSRSSARRRRLSFLRGGP